MVVLTRLVDCVSVYQAIEACKLADLSVRRTGPEGLG